MLTGEARFPKVKGVQNSDRRLRSSVNRKVQIDLIDTEKSFERRAIDWRRENRFDVLENLLERYRPEVDLLERDMLSGIPSASENFMRQFAPRSQKDFRY